MTISGNPPSFQYDEPRSMTPEAIKQVSEAIRKIADAFTFEPGIARVHLSFSEIHAIAVEALALLAAEQAKAPPDRGREEIIQRAAKEFTDTAFHSFGLSQPRLDEYAGVFAELIRSVIAELRLSPVTAGEWQDISTALKDGQPRLLGCIVDGRLYWAKAGQWRRFGWFTITGAPINGPTHFAPLPPPPKEAGR